MGVGSGSSKSDKNKCIKSVWCVLLVALLLVAVAEADDCDDLCDGYTDFAKYDNCMTKCDAPFHLHLKRFAGGKQEEARRNVLERKKKKTKTFN
jgi:hypothetical protein